LQITVETAHMPNLDELLRIERECFTTEAFTKEQIEILFRNPTAVGLLARIDGEVAGFVIGMIETYGATKAGHVYTIDVAVKHRRMGVGIKLLKEMEHTFMKKGAETSYLEVRADNQAARRLYRKRGYVEVETLDDYYSRGVQGLRLRKQLKTKRNASSQP